MNIGRNDHGLVALLDQGLRDLELESAGAVTYVHDDAALPRGTCGVAQLAILAQDPHVETREAVRENVALFEEGKTVVDRRRGVPDMHHHRDRALVRRLACSL